MMKTFFQNKLLPVIILSVFAFSSCKDDDDDDSMEPAYVGTWAAYSTETYQNIPVEVKDELILTEINFSNILKVKNPFTNIWIDGAGFKGTLMETGDTLDISINEAGMTELDPYTQMPTGEIQYYKENQPEFLEILSEYDIPKNFKTEYSRSGNTLNLKTDINKDGDFNDENESVDYTRE